MRLTKLQQEYIDQELKDGDYVAFHTGIFKSDEYREWKRLRRENEL